MISKLLITGGTGFIGQALYKRLKFSKYLINISTRKNDLILPKEKNTVIFNTGEINHKTEWFDALTGVDCIIHCAGRAHITKELKKNPIDIYRNINVEGTINLAKQAVTCGVKRLIFLSSIKVNGEKTYTSSSYKFNDSPYPEDAYGISKWEAEQGLLEVSRTTGLEVVIVRPTLVYGYGVKGNLARLIKLIDFGLPLPFGLVNNKRSLIGIDNLVEVLCCCIESSEAKGKTFLVSDGEDLSTPDLINHIASAMGRSVYLFPFPVSFLKFFGSLVGKKNEIDRLTGSLQVDIKYTREILNWKPSVSVNEGVKRMFSKF